MASTRQPATMVCTVRSPNLSHNVSFISSSQTILTGRVTRPLEEGQYAVVLRPRAAAVAGADVLTDAGDGLAMATVFRFRIGR